MAGSITKQVILPPALGSYCYIFKPRPKKDPSKKDQYGVSLLWDKSEEKLLAELKKAIVEVAVAKYGPDAPKRLGKDLHCPLRDGDHDKPTSDLYKIKLFANANSSRPPQVVKRDGRTKIFEEADAFSGCIYRAAVTVYPFEADGKKGVALGLNALQVTNNNMPNLAQKDAAELFKDFAEADGQPQQEQKATGTSDAAPAGGVDLFS